MQTFKTAVVVVLLLGVCYGAYVALNAPEPTLPESLKDWNDEALALDVENGASVDIPQLVQTPAPNGLDSLAPPAVTPPPPSGPATPNLSLPAASNLASNSSTNKTPDIITPPTLGGEKDAKAPLGNDIPSLPELPRLSATKEGDAVPLPGATDFGPVPPPLAGSTSNTESPSSVPIPPLPGSSDGDKPDSSSSLADSFPQAPGTSSGSGIIAVPASTGIPTNTKSPASTAQPFAQVREQALKLANEGKLREALAMVSPYYNHIELTREEHLDLNDLLDALAGEVIYSRRHLLESKYIVSSGETLESIANKYRVSPEALANINRLGDSKVVLAGTELKVLNGPFRCEVALTKGELTLFLGELYAGRFPISVGKEPAPTEGTFSIVERRRDHAYVGPDSKYMTPTDPRNPYGGYWMHLGDNLCIHGSPEVSTPESESAGCISLAPLDAKEVYTLLTQGSQVIIKR